MLLGEMITAAQNELVDTKGTDLTKAISTPEWILFANEGVNQACRRAHLITDSTTTEICQRTVTAGNPIIILDKRILRIKRVVRASDGIKLEKTRIDILDAQNSSWQNDTGDIDYYAEDFQSNSLLLYRKPVVNDTLNLTLIRLQLENMVDVNTDEPETNPSTHYGIIKWMLYRAFSKRDIDLEPDWPRAREALARFEEEFGPPISAREEIWTRTIQGIDPLEGQF